MLRQRLKGRQGAGLIGGGTLEETGTNQLVCILGAGLKWDCSLERKGDVRVDDANHAGLAVLALRAVEPDGRGVVERDGVCRQVGRSCRDRHEAGEQAGGVGLDVVDGLAGLVKGRLDDGMVLRGKAGSAKI